MNARRRYHFYIMEKNSKSFWQLSILEKASQARKLLEQLESATIKPPATELALMRIALTRLLHGGSQAEKEFAKADASGLFHREKPFQYHYQKALNAYSQGLFKRALEFLLPAQGQLVDAHEELMAHTTRLLCLHNLSQDTRGAWADLRDAMKFHDHPENTEIVAFISRTVNAVAKGSAPTRRTDESSLSVPKTEVKPTSKVDSKAKRKPSPGRSRKKAIKGGQHPSKRAKKPKVKSSARNHR